MHLTTWILFNHGAFSPADKQCTHVSASDRKGRTVASTHLMKTSSQPMASNAVDQSLEHHLWFRSSCPLLHRPCALHGASILFSSTERLRVSSFSHSGAIWRGTAQHHTFSGPSNCRLPSTQNHHFSGIRWCNDGGARAR